MADSIGFDRVTRPGSAKGYPGIRPSLPLMEEERVRSSLLTPHVRTRLTLYSDRIQAFVPRTFLGLIPMGSEEIAQPLKTVRNVSVQTRLETDRLMLGACYLIVGVVLLFISDPLGPGVILIGGLLSARSFGADFVIEGSSGVNVKVPISIFDRKRAWSFARAVNTIVVSAALANTRTV